MVTEQVVPYGKWESVIGIDDATAGSTALSSPRGDVRTGRVFYLEALPSGASTIVEVIPKPVGTDGSPSFERAHVLPAPHSVSTGVYEYGGGSYDVLPSTRDTSTAGQQGQQQQQLIVFSDAKDSNALKLLNVDTGSVTALVSGKPHLRYADFGPHPSSGGGGGGGRGKYILAIEEDHTNNAAPADVQDVVVAVHVETGKVTRLVAGSDFYSTPRFSPDGRRVSWRAWEHPEMPWTNSRLCWAEVLEEEEEEEVEGGGTGGIALDAATVQVVAGGQEAECVGESAWGPDGALYFTYEQQGSDWRQMWRIWPGEDAKPEKLALEGLDEAELGDCSMLMDNRTFGFLSPTSMVLAYTRYATYHTVHVDLKTLAVTPLDVPLIDTRSDPVAAISPNSFLVIGSGVTQPQGVYHVVLTPDLKATMTEVRLASSISFSSDLFSRPQHIVLTSKHAPTRPIHGFYWPPHNPKFTAPAGTRPPLLVNPHGGPTGHLGAGLKIGGVGGGNVPFWTSRGFAYFAINYTGSSGHGRAYRQRLDGQWGLLDRDDVPECIDYLCADERGLADRRRVGIHGASAGGYNVLQSLVWHPEVFAAGVCYCGVSDVKKLEEGTHKLESHYLEGLLFDPGMSDEEKEARMYERSPVWHAERITAPLLLCHGDADTVVPIAQSYEIERRVRMRNGTVEMVVAPGEGHMFKMKASMQMVMEKEVAWFMKYLVGE